MEGKVSPSEEEQELVRKYVMERPLYRPPVTYFKVVMLFFSGLIFLIGLSIATYHALQHFGVMLRKSYFFILFFIVSFIIFSRWLGILLVRLYQHYAPEEVRRRCLLKPTCSEYAIIVLRKYGLIIGGIKIWIRLKYKCRGNVYHIDEP